MPDIRQSEVRVLERTTGMQTLKYAEQRPGIFRIETLDFVTNENHGFAVAKVGTDFGFNAWLERR